MKSTRFLIASACVFGLTGGFAETSLAASNSMEQNYHYVNSASKVTDIVSMPTLPYPLQAQSGMAYQPAPKAESPLTTVTGPGGVAKLNVLTSAKELAWSVTPYGMISSWDFQGTITIDVLDPQTRQYVYDDTIYVSGSGVPGGSTGGNVSIANYPTGLSYTATLNGTATDIIGDTDTVLPGCQVSWYFTN
ncbi:hypothetical protein SAMN04489725_1315 [Alicyclobacillus hesperidum]|uniref:DUF5626 domain-containing protein n=1 Tax=Alicyclobacillus hesperidum TaxID=89784 RepID=A0A1H2YAH8_9BACL|nr:hypothetical protein [Alicyclobacillus hesperidum]SDX02040.1 hypothetical protein SAMN04489725_1315 [Alicyclobacillus hesperidum]